MPPTRRAPDAGEPANLSAQLVVDAIDATCAYAGGDLAKLEARTAFLGHLLSPTDARHHTTRYAYDAQGSLWQEFHADNSSAVASVVYANDAFGQHVKVTQNVGATAADAANAVVTSYGFDRLGHQTSRTSATVNVSIIDGGGNEVQGNGSITGGSIFGQRQQLGYAAGDGPYFTGRRRALQQGCWNDALRQQSFELPRIGIRLLMGVKRSPKRLGQKFASDANLKRTGWELFDRCHAPS